MANPDDQKRDAILRYLYQRHKSARGIAMIPVGIQDLQREMKDQHAMKQAEVSSNLDYLVQVGWVREVVKERSFKTPRGMELSREQTKYKISDVGIDHLEAGTMFKKPDAIGHVNITNVRGVTIVGDGNVVNSEFADASRALDELDRAVDASTRLSDEQKLDAAGDLSTIRTQIAKKNPDHSIIRAAWGSLEKVATVAAVGEAVLKVKDLLSWLLR